MTWVVPLALGGLAVLLMAVFTMLSARKRQHQTTAPATQVGPRILIHDINDDRCTGCDACVAVCPTNVLDLVANKSRVLRFHDCIQCEACMFACPTEALVMFPEGAQPPPLKVPEIDENFQTVVPGQYLIGEVAGKPLVKSAANLGRAVIEHMLRTGMRPGALGRSMTVVDVAIVGSGPGGLSAALTCIQRGLTFVVLEKEQQIASTIARYPKGKLVMAEPYDTDNLSFLPVFDSAKEQLIPIWRELMERVQLRVNQGESVESVQRAADGAFDIRTTVSSYRAQRVVLSIGTRGKPRTLQVPGENLPKVFSLLEDPDEWRGRSVLVVGGGDSACEAALALADAGAKVIISYRGKGFNRAAPKNKQAIEAYAAEGRIKAKLGSQVLQFEPDSVTLALADGSQKRYPNDGAFVLIGADPPVQWLEKMGVRFVERPHQYQMGKTDDILRRFVPNAMPCPEDAARAAAAILGGSTGVEPSVRAPIVAANPAGAVSLPMPMGEPAMSGPRKWLRSATSIFSTRGGTNAGQPVKIESRSRDLRAGKKFDAPVPLSEFAKRSREPVPPGTQPGAHHAHTGHGRRDALSAGERTRILRMLRDEGGRLADEDSQVYIGAAPPANRGYDFDLDDAPAAPPMPSQPLPAGPVPTGNAAMPTTMLRPDIDAKPAVVVGIAQARSKRQSAGAPPPPPQPMRAAPPPPAHLRVDPPMTLDSQPPMRLDSPPMTLPPDDPMTSPARSRRNSGPPPMPASQPPPPPRARNNSHQPMTAGRRPVPPPFTDEPTRQADDDILGALRQAAAQRQPPSPTRPPPSYNDEPTRMANIDPRAYDETGLDPLTGPRGRIAAPEERFMANAPTTEPGNEEKTRMANLDALAAEREQRRKAKLPPPDERTRAVNIRNDPSISDIDWDLD